MTELSGLLTHMEEKQEDLLELVRTLISYKTPAPPARYSRDPGVYCFVCKRNEL